ncbi:MAG: ISKra4 family transposase [Planctomycetes bacterium]|nr:ISKra4 family transposase [Planctomycetota bacterium]MCB9888640.1 ISKra4 family transposase [Planctomycetota bacterium]
MRNGPILDPIGMRTGAYGRGWLPLTAQCIANDVQRGPSREAEDAARQTSRLPYSRASFERVAHLVGEHWLREHADIEDQLAWEFDLPAEAVAISVALDRVSVPMEEAAKRSAGRPRKGAPTRPVERNFRMAYCATITMHDAAGESLHTLRYGCMPASDHELWFAQIANEAHRLVEQRPGIRIKLLSDGAPEMCNLLQTNFPATVFSTVEQGIDFWHVIEKLAPAAEMLFGKDHCSDELRRWRKRLRCANAAAEEILTELRDSGMQNRYRDSKRPVHEAITYFENHLDRMRFARSLRLGLPIGSGNVEATCKTLVGVRMKRAGSRWKTCTGEHVLRLRALALSDRWEPAMLKLHATRRTAVRVAA